MHWGNRAMKQIRKGSLGSINANKLSNRLTNNSPKVDFDSIHAIEFELDCLLEEDEIYWK